MGRGAAVAVGGGDTGCVFAGAEALLETLLDEGDDVEEEDEEERAVRRSQSHVKNSTM